MPCFKPLRQYWTPGGKTFNSAGTSGAWTPLPCGRCIGCRIDYSKMWAARMVQESRFHQESRFLTLTYSDEQLPPGPTLVKSHTQDFLKSYRNHLWVIARKNQQPTQKIRYYLCGEYGEQNLRPHYHCILFGHSFPDEKLFSKGDYPLFTSDTLTEIWGRGHCTIGEVNADTCGYTARYVTKKISGPAASNHYERVLQSGEIISVLPEFATMSRGGTGGLGGIGKRHFDTYKNDIYPDDFIILNGNKSKTPRYYDKLLEASDPEAMARIKLRRQERAESQRKNNTRGRLAARETCLNAKLSTLKRDL